MPKRNPLTCLLLVTAGILLVASLGRAQPAPPGGLVADDHPWDNGEKIDLSWEPSPDDATGVTAYKVYRSLTAGEVEHRDAEELKTAVKDARRAAAQALMEEAGLPEGAELPAELALRIREARAASAAFVEASRGAAAEARAEETQYKFLTFLKPGVDQVMVEGVSRHEEYTFRVTAVGAGGESAPAMAAAPIRPARQLFDGGRLALFLITAIICGAVILFIQRARGGKPLNIRKIAGLDAVTEAVGRATEMGRPILFIPGIQDMNDIQTIAGLTILSKVARTAAEYEAKIEVPTTRALVMTAARETVQASFLSAARPDAYDENLIYYVTDEQFGYVAYVSGHMVREKPAACFYMGSFFAESLILAETGNAVGAIQVAGTAQPAQLPFFVAACDYTLIGEEFFAASAYLSGEPEQLGSLKGQDVGKVLVAIFMVVGVGLATLGVLVQAPALSDALNSAVEFIRNVLLT